MISITYNGLNLIILDKGDKIETIEPLIIRYFLKDGFSFVSGYDGKHIRADEITEEHFIQLMDEIPGGFEYPHKDAKRVVLQTVREALKTKDMTLREGERPAPYSMESYKDGTLEKAQKAYDNTIPLKDILILSK